MNEFPDTIFSKKRKKMEYLNEKFNQKNLFLQIYHDSYFHFTKYIVS